ncbi:MAG: metal-dependent hydrolase [Bryobacteraceae bacterium]
MDNITHALTGLMMSRAGLNRLTPRASLILVIATNMPDFELPIMFISEEVYLRHHRVESHGFLAAPLLACIPVLIASIRRRNSIPWARAWLVSLAGVLSHLLLDWTNIYGVQLLAPLRSRWFALEIMSVFDVWVWLALGIATLWPLLERLVSAEIGARPRPGRKLAVLALLFLLAYGAGRFVLRQRAVAVQEVWLYRDKAPARVAAFPNSVNPFRWRGLVETERYYVVQEVDLNREFDAGSGRLFYKAPEQDVLRRARESPAFEIFRGWSRYPVFTVASLPGNGVKVQVTDFRFAEPGEERCVATALFDEQGRLTRSWFQFDPPGVGPNFR